ncbi:MAG: hypothetical protein LAO19_14085 [Acidobacteriia bacterium]|nr:hypothetical protein [Terriglobia bacterium]
MKKILRGMLLAVAGLLLLSLGIPARAGASVPPTPAPTTRVRKNKVEKPAKRFRNRKIRPGKSRGTHPRNDHVLSRPKP